MKKIIVILAVLMLPIILCACGNLNLGFGNFTFEHIHFSDHMVSYCATVDEWNENDTGIEVLTDEYGSMFLSEGTYILIESDKDCPFCGNK